MWRRCEEGVEIQPVELVGCVRSMAGRAEVLRSTGCLFDRTTSSSAADGTTDPLVFDVVGVSDQISITVGAGGMRQVERSGDGHEVERAQVLDVFCGESSGDGYAFVSIAKLGFEFIEGSGETVRLASGAGRDINVDGWLHRHVPKLHGEATYHHELHTVSVEGVGSSAPHRLRERHHWPLRRLSRASSTLRRRDSSSSTRVPSGSDSMKACTVLSWSSSGSSLTLISNPARRGDAGGKAMSAPSARSRRLRWPAG